MTDYGLHKNRPSHRVLCLHHLIWTHETTSKERQNLSYIFQLTTSPTVVIEMQSQLLLCTRYFPSSRKPSALFESTTT
jgi:hypothetical protein